jgi:hypothetical protein
MQGRGEKRGQGFGGKVGGEKDQVEDEGIDGRMGSKCTSG